MKRLRIIISSLLLVLCVVAVIYLLHVLAPQEIHQQARDAVSSGDYERAEILLAGLPESDDKAVMEEQCLLLKAEALQAAGDYEQAGEIYRQFGQDDPRYLAVRYQQAEQYMEHDLPLAIEAFAQLGQYEDSAARCQQGQYSYGIQLLAQGYYYSAIQLLEAAGDYLDSQQLAQEANYRLAMTLFRQEEYLASRPFFTAAGQYQDAAQHAAVVEQMYHYEELIQLASEGRYSEAIDRARNISENYRERETIVGLLEQANQLRLEGQWQSVASNDVGQPKYDLHISSMLQGTELHYQCRLEERQAQEVVAKTASSYVGILQQDNTVLLSSRVYSNGLRKYQLRLEGDTLYLEDVLLLEEEEPVINEEAQWQFVRIAEETNG